MKTVLILGGGFGGIATAHRLKQLLGSDVAVTLVDKRDTFMVGFRKSWGLVNEAPMEEGQRPLNDLTKIGVKVIQGTISSIDPNTRSAEVDGQHHEADALVVALGADLAPGAIRGFKEHAYNVYDPNDIPRAAQALKDFKEGRILVGIFGAPYKCSPAPFEMALLIDASLKARGLRASIKVFSPQPMSIPILGRESCNTIEGRLSEKGVDFLPNHKALSIEKGEIVFADDRESFDLLFGVPPHTPPAVVKDSGLVDSKSGWINVNAKTLETSFPGVYAIGDVVQIAMPNGKPLPKAGVFAEGMGETVAERIAAEFKGGKAEATFKGEGGCYLEVGGGQAMMVTGRFMAEPEPEVMLTEATAQYMTEKRAFETDRLKKWFG
jgi:sulfide:quinone oxidoreductase